MPQYESHILALLLLNLLLLWCANCQTSWNQATKTVSGQLVQQIFTRRPHCEGAATAFSQRWDRSLRSAIQFPEVRVFYDLILFPNSSRDSPEYVYSAFSFVFIASQSNGVALTQFLDSCSLRIHGCIHVIVYIRWNYNLGVILYTKLIFGDVRHGGWFLHCIGKSQILSILPNLIEFEFEQFNLTWNFCRKGISLAAWHPCLDLEFDAFSFWKLWKGREK